MKKLALALAGLIFIFIQANSQEINYDKTNEQGNRVISTSASNLYTKFSSAAAIGMSAIKVDDENIIYLIDLTLNEGKQTFDEGRKLLLKTASNDLIELRVFNKIGQADYTYKVTNYGTHYYTSPSYEISKENIEKIINNEIIKIRIETNAGEIDREIKKNKLSKTVKSCFDIISAELSKPKSIYDGF